MLLPMGLSGRKIFAGNMALQKHVPFLDAPSGKLKSLSFSIKAHEKAHLADMNRRCTETDVDIDLREVYFLIMHFLSAGPCQRTYGQLWNELLEHQLLPRRYHAWYSRRGEQSGDENDDGLSFPLSYNKLVDRHLHIEKDHLVKLLRQLLLGGATSSPGLIFRSSLNAAAVPTLLGTGSFSLLDNDKKKESIQVEHPPGYMHWPHMQADQVRGLRLREIGGGFSRHHRAPSIRAACYAIVKPSTMVQKMQNIKKLRGHRTAVYCAIFDRLGRYVITGSDDRLVKIWSMETALCLASCRGHEGDITDLAVSFNNALVASASNDCIIRVWRVADGYPISVLRGHTGAVTAIAFSPRSGSVFQLLSSSDDGTCRIWDARNSQFSPRIYIPKPPDSSAAGRTGGPSLSTGQQGHQIFCCAFNANGTVFVTGSSDTLARVWNACKPNNDDPDQPNHEMDVLAGHENDVNYVQFSGCAVISRFYPSDASREESLPKFRNTWFTHDNIVTCSRDGSAIIWIPRSRRSHGKVGRWTRAYHLKVPPPPMPPQPLRGGPRQRILPTPRGVNMIVWSSDNRFVLAAIMDCRICVWNAVDGSLVHSLTGHTESTYVLDVHPFNPRIAMSAGYDGKTIVWDIWEGIPIRVYEIGRFKLVDGKFSSDGTSIILSDDVGQLYILSTGQGESQMDAKYDQFFLGDYRPLMKDAHGNVLDQETNLPPYKRNMQDLLCDSGMIPYPEPYQSMYQQRRLGALGIEWRPQSLRFAVGTDINLDQEYQMPPIADLDILIDPLPEFLDAMDWEPEIEMQSDDNDSEYNATEDYHSGGEQGSLSCNSSGNLQFSDDDSEEDQDNHENNLRRSKRKKLKTDVKSVTSSGRRVKRRNLDSHDGSFKIKQSRKLRIGRKASRKKTSLSKSMRPRRAAARNALNLFSRITGRSTDGEEEECLEGNSSETDSSQQDSDIGSEVSAESSENEQNERPKDKETIVYVSDDVFTTHISHESNTPAGKRRKLIFKLPIRDLNKSTENKILDNSQTGGAGTSSTVPQLVSQFNHNSIPDPGCSFFENGDGIAGHENANPVRVQNYFNLLEGYTDGRIRWGGVKSRSTKRSKVAEPQLLSAPVVASASPNGYHKKELHSISSSSEIQNQEVDMDETVRGMRHQFGVEPIVNNAAERYTIAKRQDYVDGRAAASVQPTEEGQAHALLPTKFRIKSRVISADQENPAMLSIKSSMEDPDTADGNELPENQSDVPDYGSSKKPISDDGPHAIDTQVDRTSGSVLQNLAKLDSSNRTFKVYKRSKSFRARRNVADDSGNMDASTSNVVFGEIDERTEPTNQSTCRTRSMCHASATRDLTSVSNDVNFRSSNDVNFRSVLNDSEDASTSIERTSANEGDELPHEEWRASSRMTVGLRSTRSRRGIYYCRDFGGGDVSFPAKRKSHQLARGSWLMLSMHEDGPRYIPQLGDEVVYLRQGHQDYLTESHSREVGPWRAFKGSIKAVEFCRVEDLEYSTRPGSGESCCKLTLQFSDTTSSLAGKLFNLTLPEVTGFPDFLVERSRYDAAIDRNWMRRDRCSVWWKNESGEGGSWWDGRILFVEPKSLEFPDSPWERFSVRYKNDSNVHKHSPWELDDDRVQWEEPHIDEEIREKVLSAIAKLLQSGNKSQDRYGVQKLKEVSQKTNFINRFPVPLSIEIIQARLESNYYRRLGAMKHDVEVVLANAESFFGRNEDLLSTVKRLSDWFTRTLSSL